MNEKINFFESIIEKVKNIPIWIEDNYEWFSVIVTLLAVIVALWTLFEMKIQRNKTYQPDIVFSNLRLFVDTGITEIEGEKIKDIKYAFIPAGEKWDICNSTENVTIKISDFRRKEFYVAIPAFNTGFGVCKNLRCVYSLRCYKKWVKLLINSDIIKYDDENKKFWGSCNTESSIGTFEISNKKTVIPETFLKPNSETQYNIKLPYEYCYFLMTIQNLDDFNKIQHVDLPKIKVFLKYKDVQGKKYNRYTSIKIKPFSTTVSQNNSIVFIYDFFVE